MGSVIQFPGFRVLGGGEVRRSLLAMRTAAAACTQGDDLDPAVVRAFAEEVSDPEWQPSDVEGILQEAAQIEEWLVSARAEAMMSAVVQVREGVFEQQRHTAAWRRARSLGESLAALDEGIAWLRVRADVAAPQPDPDAVEAVLLEADEIL